MSNYFSLKASSLKAFPPCIYKNSISKSSDFIKVNSPLSASYETIEYLDRELINSLNQYDMSIIGNYLDSQTTGSSRPISLLTVNSDETINNNQQQLIIDNDVEEENYELVFDSDDTFEKLYENESQSKSEDKCIKHKLDNLKKYSFENCGNGTTDLYKTLELFLKFNDNENENKNSTNINTSDQSEQNTYAEPFDYINKDKNKNNSKHLYVIKNTKKDANYVTNRTNRLFYNFNNNKNFYINNATRDFNFNLNISVVDNNKNNISNNNTKYFNYYKNEQKNKENIDFFKNDKGSSIITKILRIFLIKKD